jgi:TRAP-type C4-dicarboxylate transport system permease small subunit
MAEKAANEIKGGPPSSGIGKAAWYLDKILTPVSTYVAYVGAAVLGGLVLMLMYTIVARRLFSAPLKGSLELTELALVLITFLILAYDSLRGESIIVDVIVSHFPRRAREITAAVIYFLATAMLGVLSRQLIVQATRVHGYGQTTPMLEWPVYPFIYVAAFGTILLTVVYLKHFLNSLSVAVRR